MLDLEAMAPAVTKVLERHFADLQELFEAQEWGRPYAPNHHFGELSELMVL